MPGSVVDGDEYPVTGDFDREAGDTKLRGTGQPAGRYVVAPAMCPALHLVPAELAAAQCRPLVEAAVLDGVDGAVDIEQGDVLAFGTHGA